MSLGPSAPGGNHNVPLDAYKSLVSGDCRHVADVGQYADEPYNRLLYIGVGNACLAAFEGEPQRWAVAERNLALLAGQRDRTGCYGRTAYDLLDALVTAHRDNPDRTFQRQQEAAGSGGCVLVQSVTPNSGPVSGGYEVTLTGRNFPDEGLITVVDATPRTLPPVVPFTSTYRGTQITVRMPAVDEVGPAYLIVDGADEYWNSAVTFRFQHSPWPETSSGPGSRGPEHSPEPTPTPTPTPTPEPEATVSTAPVPTATPPAS